MTAKEYLGQARRMDGQIEAKRAQVDKLRALVTKVTPAIYETKTADGVNIRTMEDLINKIHELEKEINATIDEYVDKKTEIMGVIEKVEAATKRALLEWYYLAGLTWREVAEKMQYTEDRIYQLHREALHAVKDYIELQCGAVI